VERGDEHTQGEEQVQLRYWRVGGIWQLMIVQLCVEIVIQVQSKKVDFCFPQVL
jgi:hypothetical protein